MSGSSKVDPNQMPLSPRPFGALLRRQRVLAGLTQETLAERAGLSARAISDLERGVNRTPQLGTLDLLAEALQLSVEERARFVAAARQEKLADPPAPTPFSAAHAGVQQAAIDGARPLKASPAARHQLSISPSPLIGREVELALIERHLASEGPPLLLLAGEPGVGKSRLLAEASQRARAQGWTVLEAGCHPRSRQEPYEPLLLALSRALHGLSPAAQQDHLHGCSWLVRLLPELVEVLPSPAVEWSLPPEQERRLMFAAVLRFLTSIASPAGLLLVLDDLQWAGADALDLLASLLRAYQETPLRVLGAYRSTEVQSAGPLGALLAELAPSHLVNEQRLEQLAPQEASDLLTSLLKEAGVRASELQQRVLARTGCLPFFLVSYVQALRAGALTDTEAGVPWDVAQSIRQRVLVLPAGARELLSAAAIVGRRAERVVLTALAQPKQEEQETLVALEALCQSRLLLEEGEEAYQFAHDLVREVVLADLSAARRASLHRRVAAALEQMPGEPSVERLAYHFSRAGDTAKAAHYLEQAGDRAWVLFANVEAETAYRELLAHLERLGRPADRARAYEKLSLPLRFLGRHTEALAAVEAALGLYQMLGDVEGQGRVLARLGHFHAGVGTPKEGLECVQPLVAPLCAAGLSLSGQSALSTALSRLYYNIAENTDITEESEKRALQSESLAAASQAEALAEQAHDEHLLGLAMSRRGATLLLLEREEEGAQVLEDAIRLLEASGDLEALWVALNNVGNFYLDRGEYTLALPHTERALAIAERLGDQEGIADKKQKRGDIFFALGQWEQARQNLDQADAFLREAPVSFPLVFLHFDLGLLALAQRQAEEAAEHFRCALVLAEQIKHPYLLFWASSSLADLDLVEGRPEGARARLEPFLDRSSLGAGEQAWVRRQLGWASLELGDLERAEVLLEEASTLARAHHLAGFLVGVLHSQARLALWQGRGPEAAQVLEEALALTQARQTPYEEAQTLYLSGLLHLQQGETQLARERLEAALAICTKLGERLYAEQIERRLAELER